MRDIIQAANRPARRRYTRAVVAVCDDAAVSFKDHFSAQAAEYVTARPQYPPALFAELAQLAPGHALAWDAGTGNGQAAVGLAAHFDRVVATEPSTAQLAQALVHPRVQYHRSAETAPVLADRSVDLVSVAQAAHWFDLGVFYPEIKRVLRPRGVVAFWVYELCHISPEIDEILNRFYRGPIWPYWPPERRQVEEGYRNLVFPFQEIAFPACVMEHTWTLAEFAAYLRTWSSVVRYMRATGVDPVGTLVMDLEPRWGPGARKICWPLSGRLGLGPA